MTMTILRNLAPAVLVAGAALAYTAQRVRATRQRHQMLELPLGRITFAMNLVRTGRHRSSR